MELSWSNHTQIWTSGCLQLVLCIGTRRRCIRHVTNKSIGIYRPRRLSNHDSYSPTYQICKTDGRNSLVGWDDEAADDDDNEEEDDDDDRFRWSDLEDSDDDVMGGFQRGDSGDNGLSLRPRHRQQREPLLVVGIRLTPSQASLAHSEEPAAQAHQQTTSTGKRPPRPRGMKAFAGLERGKKRPESPLTIQHIAATLQTDLPGRLLYLTGRGQVNVSYVKYSRVA
jgi:hypothetical protein